MYHDPPFMLNFGRLVDSVVVRYICMFVISSYHWNRPVLNLSTRDTRFFLLDERLDWLELLFTEALLLVLSRRRGLPSWYSARSSGDRSSRWRISRGR